MCSYVPVGEYSYVHTYVLHYLALRMLKILLCKFPSIEDAECQIMKTSCALVLDNNII